MLVCVRRRLSLNDLYKVQDEFSWGLLFIRTYLTYGYGVPTPDSGDTPGLLKCPTVLPSLSQAITSRHGRGVRTLTQVGPLLTG